MNDRQSNHLRHGSKQALQGTKGGKGGIVRRKCCTQDHEHGDDLGPDPDRESGRDDQANFKPSAQVYNSPSISFDQRNGEDTTKALK